MRNAIRLLGILGVAALVVAVATPVSANCNPPKVASTFIAGGTTVYWAAPADANLATLRGQFWTMGNRAAGNEGACTVNICGPSGTSPWLYFYNGDRTLGTMNLTLGTAEVAGCPTGRLLTTAQVDSTDGKKTYFLAGTVDEISGPAVDFLYNTPQVFVEVPRAHIVSRSRVGTTENLHFGIQAPAGGVFGPGAAGTITGYRLVVGTGTGTADPGRGGAVYTPLAGGQVTTPTADIPVSVDCTGILLPAEKYVGVQILFSDGVTSSVSSTYRVGCDPSLANPGKGFKPVNKGPKNIQNPNN